MASKTERITALEERLEALEALVNDPISLLTEALKTADAATLKSFMEVMNAVVTEHAPVSAAASAAAPATKKAKTPKEPTRAAANKEGPTAWNAEVKEVEEALVAEGKTRVKKKTGELGEDEFNYDFLLKEASIRKLMREEGLERDAAEAKAAEKTAAKEAKKASKTASEAGSVRSEPAPAVKKPAAKKAPKVKKSTADEAAVAAMKEMGASDEDLAELATLGIFPRYLEDMPYYVDSATNEVFQAEDGGICGSRIGVYNEKTGELK
jgi:hypothetical protein